MTAALSLYAESTPSLFISKVFLIIANRDFSWPSPSISQDALKILWRQCSEFAWANIINSTSVGSRSSSVNAVTGNQFRRPPEPGPGARLPQPERPGRQPAPAPDQGAWVRHG